MPPLVPLEFKVTARPADVPGIAERGDSRGVVSRGVISLGVRSRGVKSRGVKSRGVVSRGVKSRGVPSRGVRGESRGEARGEFLGETRGELARSGCRKIDETEPPCLMVSAGLWLPELLLGEPGDETVTCRERGGAGSGPRSGDCGRYWPPLTDERTYRQETRTNNLNEVKIRHSFKNN